MEAESSEQEALLGEQRAAGSGPTSDAAPGGALAASEENVRVEAEEGADVDAFSGGGGGGGGGGDDDDRDENFCRAYATRCKANWRVFFSVALTVGLTAIKGNIMFPFIRTLVACPPGTPGVNLSATDGGNSSVPSSPQWSGSPLCVDRVYVANAAQAISGKADGLGMGLSIFALPLLGLLGDQWGRRPLWLLSAFGVAAELGLLLVSAATGTPWLIYVGASINSVTSCFNSMAQAMVADTSRSDSDRAANFSALVVITLVTVVIFSVAASGGIVGANLGDYTWTFAVLAGAGVAVLAALAALLRETLDKKTKEKLAARRRSSGSSGARKKTDGDEGEGEGRSAKSEKSEKGAKGGEAEKPAKTEKAGLQDEAGSEAGSEAGGAGTATQRQEARRKDNCERLCRSVIDLFAQFWRNKLLLVIALVAFFIALAVSVATVAKAYFIKQFEMSQTLASFLLLGFGAVGLASVILSPLIQRWVGSVRTVLMGGVAVVIGLAFFTVSPMGSKWRPVPLNCLFVLLGGFAFTFTGASLPAYLSVVSREAQPGKEAELLAALGSLITLGMAVGSVLYSAMFAQQGVADRIALPFLVATGFASLGVGIMLVGMAFFPDKVNDRPRRASGSR